MKTLQQVENPTDTIIELAELKAHLGISHALDDTRLTLLLETVRDFLEHETGLCFTDQVWEETFPCFPNGNCIELRMNPVGEATVTYLDLEGEEQTFEDFEILRTSHQTKLVLHANAFWPDTLEGPASVTVTYDCGFEEIPARIKQAALQLAATWNEHREAESTASTKQLELGVDRIIKGLRRGWIC